MSPLYEHWPPDLVVCVLEDPTNICLSRIGHVGWVHWCPEPTAAILLYTNFCPRSMTGGTTKHRMNWSQHLRSSTWRWMMLWRMQRTRIASSTSLTYCLKCPSWPTCCCWSARQWLLGCLVHWPLSPQSLTAWLTWSVVPSCGGATELSRPATSTCIHKVTQQLLHRSTLKLCSPLQTTWADRETSLLLKI